MSYHKAYSVNAVSTSWYKGMGDLALTFGASMIIAFARTESWSRKFAQRDRWSFRLMAGTLCPSNQERL